MSDRLKQLRDVLLVQCLPTELDDVLELSARPGVGVVVSTAQPRDVRRLAAGAVDRPVLVDAARYAGASRKLASAPFDPGWLQVQRDAGFAVLTDSGYLAEHDVDGLGSILGRTADHGGTLGEMIAVLPLHPWWLQPSGGLDTLVQQVNAAGLPIAVVVEHRDDPFGVARTLRGMLTLLDVTVPVIQLRTDLSGLGLLCHGAHAAAVGTQTRLRHLYPVPKKPGGGGGYSPLVATLVRECLSFVSVDKIALAVQSNPDDSLWTACTCPTCNGRQLDFIARLPEPDQPRAAFGHALDMLFTLRDGLISTDRGRRKLAWRAHCDNAAARYDELDRGGHYWPQPRNLGNWLQVPVPSPIT